MFHANIPKKFWSYAVLAATYLINRLPSRVLNSKSPLEVLKGRKIDLHHLKVFGCVCYVHIQVKHRDKLEPRAVKCLFLGYSNTQKGYKCYNQESKKLIVSRDVKFEEEAMFFPKKLVNADSEGESFSDLFPTPWYTSELPTSSVEVNEPEISNDQEIEENSDISSSDESTQPEEPVSPATPQLEHPIVPRRNPPRDRNPPARFKDYVGYHTKYPVSDFLGYQRVSSSHASFLSAIDEATEPKNFDEASKSVTWNKAMEEELRALNDNGTWSIVQLPAGKKAVGSKWIFKTKFKSDGSVERHKARLVARGFTQTYGVDYKETFAPVAKMNTVRVLLSLALNHDWSLHQMDVKNAFLHGELEEEVFMQLPPGHPNSSDPNLVCKLHKAIYGLKKSPRAWFAKLSSVLEGIGFCRSNADSSLFFRNSAHGKLAVLIYVDDLIITGNNTQEINSLKEALQSSFAMKDLGKLKYFLGIEMASSSKGLFLNQRKYVLDLLQDAKILDCKPAKTPLDSKLQLDTHSDDLQNIGDYQRIVGKLIYLTITRPDISYAVSIVSQFMHSPAMFHLSIVKRILRYLKGSIGRGILLKKNGHHDIVGYADADWAGNVLDRKSTTGFCTFVGGNLVTWKSKKQSVVARSSAEAEYRAMASAACELIWLKGLLADLGFLSSAPITLHCDNQAAMHIASNPVFHERTKHIEVDCHFIRNQVQANVISTRYVKSEDQLADIFTKSLTSAQFYKFLGKLGSFNLLDQA